jgi:diguanylate cyclase (GGDEF)-like protein/PAS domain S-box-containing protein
MGSQSGNILDILPAACMALDTQGRVLWTNQPWRALFAIEQDSGNHAGLVDWFPEEGSVAATLRQVAGTEGVVRLRARRKNGVPFTMAIMAAVDGERGNVICVGREIAGGDLLSESQRYLDVAFEMAPLGMALFDTEGRYVRVNDALCRLLDRDPAELLGRRDQEFTHPDDRQSDVDAAWRILNGELDTWQTEKRFVTGGGAVVWAIANLAFVRDSDGRPLSWLGQFQDITERKQREDVLGHLAVHDELTSIANRRGLIQELSARLAHARRYDEPGAVLVLDLDGFKQINDRAGHQAGDAVLVRTARALRDRLRVTDFIARLGGDEFAVILPHVQAETAKTVAKDLLRVIGELESADLGASCGIVLYDGATVDVDVILADADRAMYTAKSQGGNCVWVTASQET